MVDGMETSQRYGISKKGQAIYPNTRVITINLEPLNSFVQYYSSLRFPLSYPA